MIKCVSYIESLDEIYTGFTSEVLNTMDIFTGFDLVHLYLNINTKANNMNILLVLFVKLI